MSTANERTWGIKRTAAIKWKSALVCCSLVAVLKAKTMKTGQTDGASSTTPPPPHPPPHHHHHHHRRRLAEARPTADHPHQLLRHPPPLHLSLFASGRSHPRSSLPAATCLSSPLHHSPTAQRRPGRAAPRLPSNNKCTSFGPRLGVEDYRSARVPPIRGTGTTARRRM